MYEVQSSVMFSQPSKAFFSIYFVCLLYTFVAFTTVNKEYIYIWAERYFR